MSSATYHIKPSSISGHVGGESLKQKKAATTQHTQRVPKPENPARRTVA